MPQTKKKAKIPQKKKKNGNLIKLACFLMGIAITLLLIGAFNFITGTQEELKKEINTNNDQIPCEALIPENNHTKATTPEATRTVNIADQQHIVNEEI